MAAVSAGLLAGHVLAQPLDRGIVGHAIVEEEGRVSSSSACRCSRWRSPRRLPSLLPARQRSAEGRNGYAI